MRTPRTCRPLVAIDSAAASRAPVDRELVALVREPWTLRVGRVPLLIRPSSTRDLAALARMHRRCSARSLLDRYRSGGRAPAVAALDRLLRSPESYVAATPDGEVVATAALTPDTGHGPFCITAGLLVEDAWQRLGIGAELSTHLAGVAHLLGYRELIAYPATAMAAAQRLLVEIGRTRVVPDVEAHLHTFLSEAAGLGVGAVRQRLAG